MITFSRHTQYQPRDIGKVHYCSYWKTYSIILDIQDGWIYEQTLGVDDTTPGIRCHLTAYARGDKLMTTQEYIDEMKAKGELK